MSRFEVVGPLAAGGMARIDLARLVGATGFSRYVVIKRPLPHHARDAAALALFRREAELLARLHHPNIVGLVDAGRDPESEFVALEFVHGVSVRELAPPDGATVRRPALAATLTIMREVAAGLAHAHEDSLGVVHRDVTPSNVLVGYDGCVKLIDFGIAKVTDAATASNNLRGKVMYMAPEQCKAQPVDRRADVYAAGIMLYELVTGVRPFYAAEEVATLHNVVTGGPADPRTFGIDDELAAIVERSIAYDREQRFPTAGAMARAIDDYAEHHRLMLGRSAVRAEVARLVRPEPWRVLESTPVPPSIDAPSVTPSVATRSRRGVALGAVAALGLGLGAVWFNRSEEASPIEAPPTVPAAPGPKPPATHALSVPESKPPAPAQLESVVAAPPEPPPIRPRSRPRPAKPKPEPPPLAPHVLVETEPVKPAVVPVTPPTKPPPKIWDPKAFKPSGAK